MRDNKGQSVSLLYSENAAQSINGNIYVGNQLPAGAAPALWSATTQQCGLLNPSSSGKLIVPVRITGTYVSGTGVIDGLNLAYVPGCGAGVTAGGVTAATTITSVPARLGGAAGQGIFMSAAITCTAPTRLVSLGLNTEVGTAPTVVSASVPLIYDFYGWLTVPPGYAIVIAADITGITAVYSFSIIWQEIPVVTGDAGW